PPHTYPCRGSSAASDVYKRQFQDNHLMRSIEARISKINNQNLTLLSYHEAKAHLPGNSRGLEKLLELIAQSKIRHLKKKQTLYYEGDYPQGLYLLASGCIKTLKLTNDGRQLITGLYKPNEFIGLDTLLLDVPVTERAETTENSSVYFISKKTVVDLLNEHDYLN
ncbi:Crp/Fnr family transcriptional regulator, partial [Pedobacter sp. ASV12]|uniref:Crp/Fnr family transcriptional regulator n=1 Tax=Pedobacter sp. ASV12 TaxID=2795120 RepID=UPI0018EC4C06